MINEVMDQRLDHFLRNFLLGGILVKNTCELEGLILHLDIMMLDGVGDKFFLRIWTDPTKYLDEVRALEVGNGLLLAFGLTLPLEFH